MDGLLVGAWAAIQVLPGTEGPTCGSAIHDALMNRCEASFLSSEASTTRVESYGAMSTYLRGGKAERYTAASA